MRNEDGAASSFESSDTSQFMRELQALNQTGSSASYSGTLTSGEIGGSGDATLTQLMQTIYSSEPKQKIMLPGDSENEHSFSVYGREVDIYVASSEDSPRAGSNKVKITPVVNHAWEQRYYYGNLVAVHRDGDFVAFALKGKSGGNVRILKRRSADRALLKGFAGSVVDVAFAHNEDVIVAAIDEMGNLFVYSFGSGEDGKIVTTLLLHLEQQGDQPCPYHRVIWCPYWPEEGEEGEGFLQDSSKVLAYTQGEEILVLALDVVTRDYGAGPLSVGDIESGKISLVCHKEPIIDAVFSPDGSALATASLDGDVKFFQIDWSEPLVTPRCLHHWKPHNGQPLSFFTFLDDLKHMSPDVQFWKFAVTGCNKNQELKVWSCETWSCLQTVRFLSPPDGDHHEHHHEPPTLKACIDATARYLVLSDKLHMVVYVLQLHQDLVSGTAHISSVSDFPLTQPCLSFAIMEACTKKFKPSPNDSHLDEITTGELEQEVDQSQNNSEDDAKDSTTGVQIRLYAVHARALQELLIRYRPETSVSVLGSAGSVSHDGTSLRDGLSDVSVGGETSFAESELTGEDIAVAPVAHPQPTQLLSPNAFTVSNSSKLASPTGANTTAEDVLSSTSSFTHVTGLTGQNAEDLLLSPASSADQSTSAAGLSPKSPTSALSPKSAVLSPGSSVLLPKPPGSLLSPKALFTTPTTQSGKGAGESDPDLTPTNIPLPPEEEDELATPKSSHQSDDSSQVDALEAFFKPPVSTSSSQPAGEISINTGTFEVDTLAKESAVSGATTRGSTGATDTYDENDQEVAEVLGEDLDKSYSSVGSGAVGGSGVSADYTLEHTAEEERSHKPWPRPPDVPSAPEAAPVMGEALPQAVDESVMAMATGDVEDNYSEDQNEAEVEEEIEEVLEEAEDEEEEDEGEDFQKSYRDSLLDAARHGPVQIIREVVDRTLLVELQESIMKLSAEVSRQQEELCRLQQKLVEQHSVQVDLQRQQIEQATLRSEVQPTKELEQQLGRIQNVVVSRVERSLSTALQRETRLLHERLTTNESKLTAAQESLHKGVTQTLGTAAQKSLEIVVKNEFKQNVTPTMAKAVDQMKNQLHQEMSQKMTATDSVIKDQIGKIVRSRQTTDAIGQAAGGALHGPMQSLLRDVFQNRVIPAFEHSTQTMVNQVNTAFQEGTKEYSNHLKKQLEKIRQEHLSARDPIISQLTGLVESFQQTSQQMQSQMLQAVRSETSGQVKAALSSYQEQLNSGLRSVIREEVAVALREQGSKMTDSLASYLRSGAGTPVPGAHTPDVNTVQALQEQIKVLGSRGKLNDAFQTALTASNLDLVLFTCEMVNPMKVFGQCPCPLSQPVLLSLIQQLSADLTASFTTKIKYLTEAVTTLDPKDPVTQEHIPVVLEGLITKLRTYQASNPPNRDVRLLLMAANSLMAR